MLFEAAKPMFIRNFINIAFFKNIFHNIDHTFITAALTFPEETLFF